jgi:hypothetical protein
MQTQKHKQQQNGILRDVCEIDLWNTKLKSFAPKKAIPQATAKTGFKSKPFLLRVKSKSKTTAKDDKAAAPLSLI